jgi:hypothetical protein
MHPQKASAILFNENSFEHSKINFISVILNLTFLFQTTLCESF